MSESESESVSESGEKFHWQRVMELSADMQRLARAGQWGEAAVLVRERHRMITQNFKHWVTGQEARSLETAIEQLAACDRDTSGIACAQFEETSSRLRRIEQGKRALEAYRAG